MQFFKKESKTLIKELFRNRIAYPYNENYNVFIKYRNSVFLKIHIFLHLKKYG